MFRLLFLIVLAAAAFVMVDARWAPDSRTLTLRVRTARELMGVAQGTARELGDAAVERIVRENTPAVAAPPPARGGEPEAAPERLAPSDRERLDRLVQEKTREQ